MLQACIIAFAMYSKIPMPKVEWKEQSMKYALCFFPFIGVVIGCLELFFLWLSDKMKCGILFQSCVAAVISILITGGIHIDGYMDTMDALHSYQNKERKLEILKDSHIGAFAGIMLIVYYILYIGALSELNGREEYFLFGIGFIISRTLSGLALVFFPAAKKTGTLYSFASMAHKRTVRMVLIFWLLLIIGFAIQVDWIRGMGLIGGNLILFFYYKWKSQKEFGGITGDLAGWFLALSELVTAVILVFFL